MARAYRVIGENDEDMFQGLNIIESIGVGSDSALIKSNLQVGRFLPLAMAQITNINIVYAIYAANVFVHTIHASLVDIHIFSKNDQL